MKLGLKTFVTALLFGDTVLGAVMSIDFGTEWMKIGLVKPRVPFDVVLNRDSKRKTPTVLNFRKEQRTIGANGVALGVRFPSDTFEHLKLLLGEDYNSPVSEEYRVNHFNRYNLDETRNSTQFILDNKYQASVEELVAMFFYYAKQEAETAASEKVRDVVITVPTFFNQYQRQAIIEAASIADLNLLALINDGSAAALNYAMTRQFPIPQVHAFYDMGSGNTIATVAKFETITINQGKWKKNITYTDVQILGVGYDQTLGGMTFDKRVEKILLKEFETKNPTASNLMKTPRSAKKLVKEANRVKQILSANNQVRSSIESLHEEKDFSTVVTRSQFESECKDLLDRVAAPLKTALTNAQFKAEDLESVVIIGGGVRVPKVQSILKDVAGDKLSQNLNGDEAMVMGALFQAASLSSQFQVKDIRLTDLNIYKIQLTYSENGANSHSVSLYEAHGPNNQKKIVPIKSNGDFDVELDYTDKNEQKPLFHGQVKGLTDANAKYHAKSLEQKVKLFVNISPFGTARISHAKAIYTLPPPPPEPETTTSETASEEESKKNKTKEEPVTPKNVTETVRLELVLKNVGLPTLSTEQLKQAKDNLARLNQLDSDREALDEARNNLESFGYGISDFLEQTDVVKVSTPEERDSLQEKASEAMEWLSDHGDTASLEELKSKYKSLVGPKNKIIHRKQELFTRPKVIKELQKAIETTESSIITIPETLTEEQSKFIGSLGSDAQKYVDETKEWLDTVTKKQEKLHLYEEPAFQSTEVKKYIKKLDGYQIQILTKVLTMPKTPEPSSEKDSNETETEQNNTDSDKESTKDQQDSKDKVDQNDEEEEL